MEKLEFQDYLLEILPGAPPKTSYTKFLKRLKRLSVPRKRALWEIYKEASIEGLIEEDSRVKYRIFDMLPEEKEKTKARRRNRKLFEDLGLVTKHDGNEIHHKDGNALNNSPKNLKVVNAAEHRCEHAPDGEACKHLNSVSAREQIQRDDDSCTIL